MLTDEQVAIAKRCGDSHDINSCNECPHLEETWCQEDLISALLSDRAELVAVADAAKVASYYVIRYLPQAKYAADKLDAALAALDKEATNEPNPVEQERYEQTISDIRGWG